MARGAVQPTSCRAACLTLSTNGTDMLNLTAEECAATLAALDFHAREIRGNTRTVILPRNYYAAISAHDKLAALPMQTITITKDADA